MKIGTCVICGGEFVMSKNGFKKTCSNKCRKSHDRQYARERVKEAEPVQGACVVCGRLFACYITGRARTICSSLCKKRRRAGTERIRQQKKNGRSESSLRTCIVCGEPFWSAHAFKITCSSGCSAQHGKLTKREKEKNRVRRIAWPERPCAVCGVIFQSSCNYRFVCSERCRKARIKQKEKGYRDKSLEKIKLRRIAYRDANINEIKEREKLRRVKQRAAYEILHEKGLI
jgi:hypothetical protein